MWLFIYIHVGIRVSYCILVNGARVLQFNVNPAAGNKLFGSAAENDSKWDANMIHILSGKRAWCGLILFLAWSHKSRQTVITAMWSFFNVATTMVYCLLPWNVTLKFSRCHLSSTNAIVGFYCIWCYHRTWPSWFLLTNITEPYCHLFIYTLN